MKKIALIFVALVLAMGSLGVAYAAWTDTVYIDGTVSTGSVAWEIVPGSVSLKNGDPDWNMFWHLNGGWRIPTGGPFPVGYPSNYPHPDGKDVATTTVVIENTLHPSTMAVTIDNAYPYYFDHIAYLVHYYGSVPGRVTEAVVWINGEQVAVFDENSSPYAYLDFNGDNEPDLELFWGNKPYFGYQLHYSDVLDHSFEILVLQEAPQNSSLEFTIEYTIIQWNEY